MPTTFEVNTSAAARLSGARLSAVLYDTLKSRLLEGVYAAGDRIVVEQVRQEFQVSKQPVMDALRRLAADRLLASIPQPAIEGAARRPAWTPFDAWPPPGSSRSFRSPASNSSNTATARSKTSICSSATSKPPSLPSRHRDEPIVNSTPCAAHSPTSTIS